VLPLDGDCGNPGKTLGVVTIDGGVEGIWVDDALRDESARLDRGWDRARLKPGPLTLTDACWETLHELLHRHCVELEALALTDPLPRLATAVERLLMLTALRVRLLLLLTLLLLVLEPLLLLLLELTLWPELLTALLLASPLLALPTLLPWLVLLLTALLPAAPLPAPLPTLTLRLLLLLLLAKEAAPVLAPEAPPRSLPPLLSPPPLPEEPPFPCEPPLP
jgi:hypothetical protein